MDMLREWYEGLIQVLTSGDPKARFCLVAIAGLVVSYYFQTFLLRPMKYDMKKLGKDVYTLATKQYIRVAWIGWTLVFLGIGAIESVALQVAPFQLENQRDFGLALGVIFILWGTGLNFRNLMRVFVRSLREKLN